MSNISTIIFSKDRPAQLDLLLSSLEQNGNHLFDWSFVLYTYSDKEYQAGYDLCTTSSNGMMVERKRF